MSDMEKAARELIEALGLGHSRGTDEKIILRAFAEQRRDALREAARMFLAGEYAGEYVRRALREAAGPIATPVHVLSEPPKPAPARDEASAECPQCHEAGWHKLSCSYRTDGGQVRLSATRTGPEPIGYGAKRHVCPHCEHFGGFMFDELVNLPRKCRAHEHDSLTNGQDARGVCGDDPLPVCPGCHAVGEERCAPGCIDAELEAEHRHAIESGDYDRTEEA